MKCLITGASISAGHGLSQGKLDEKLWATRLLKNIDNCDIENIKNLSNAGDDNFQIFKLTSLSLMKENYKSVIVCWQNIPRTNYFFGLETYNTRFAILSSQPPRDINLLNGSSITKTQLTNMRKNLLAYYNHHWDLANLVFYVNTLINITKQKKINIRFVNYDLPWNNYKFFDRVSWNTPSSLDPFTNELLQSQQRDDSESKEIYKIIHNEYEDLGGIQEKYWLNLYEPLHSKKTDVISLDDLHPGYESQDIFTSFLTRSYSESLTTNKKTV